MMPEADHADVDSYDNRLSIANLPGLSVYLDMTCLRDVAKAKSRTSHPLQSYNPDPNNGRNHKHQACPRHRSALRGKSVFFKYI